jgi:cyclin C
MSFYPPRRLINDSYFTDVILLYPPHIIALGCMLLASDIEKIDLRFWFSELKVELGDLWGVVNELLLFYEKQPLEKSELISSGQSKLPTFKDFK